jgi:hypothetical protein
MRRKIFDRDRLEESDLLQPIRLPLAKLLPNVLTFAELFVLLSYITGYCSKVVNFHCELFFKIFESHTGKNDDNNPLYPTILPDSHAYLSYELGGFTN